MKLRAWLAERWTRRAARSRDPAEGSLWPRAMVGGRSAATALTLLLFVASLTLDDLRVFRFSAALAGGALAVVVFAFTPPFFAGRLVQRALADAPTAADTWMENALLRRRALLGLAVVLVIMWMVFFSSGRTPRW